MQVDPDLAKDIWAGRDKAVEEVLRICEANPTFENKLAAWSASYGARDKERYRALLIKDCSKVWECGERLVSELQPLRQSGKINQELAKQADTLSTILLWLSVQPQAKGYWLTARSLVFYGLKIADRALGEHTFALLCTTYVQILEESGRTSESEEYLLFARERAPFIRDKNQQTRVWKRLGALYLKRKDPVCILYFARAIFRKGIPMAVRKKALFFWR